MAHKATSAALQARRQLCSSCSSGPLWLTLPLLVRNLVQRREDARHGERRGALQHGLVAPAGLRHVTDVPQIAVHLTAVHMCRQYKCSGQYRWHHMSSSSRAMQRATDGGMM